MNRERIVRKMALNIAMRVVEHIVQLERNGIEIVITKRPFIIAGLLGEIGERLRAKSGAFGIIDTDGLRQAWVLFFNSLSLLLVEPGRCCGQIVIVIKKLIHQRALLGDVDHPTVQGPAKAVTGKDVGHVIGKRLVTIGVTVDPDRIGFLNHLVAKHIRQKGFRGLAHDIHVDRHDIGGRLYDDPLRHIGHRIGAVKRCRMALPHMRQEAKLVQIMQLLPNPKRSNGAANGSGHEIMASFVSILETLPQRMGQV